MKHLKTALLLCLAVAIAPAMASEEESESKRVMITSELYGFTVIHKGQKIEVKRNQDRTNQIKEFYRPTWRSRIQPMNPFKPHQVETIAELEMLDYIRRLGEGDDSILVIDSRLPDSTKRGIIPLAVNIPYRSMKGKELARIMWEQFNVDTTDPVWNFREAKTLVMYCNGAWCAQSPTAIKRLLRAGYPAHKIKYYRGGMQSWESFGLTVVDP